MSGDYVQGSSRRVPADMTSACAHDPVTLTTVPVPIECVGMVLGVANMPAVSCVACEKTFRLTPEGIEELLYERSQA